MKNLCFLLLSIVSLTFLTSCNVEFENPLPQNSALNESLMGDWVVYENDILIKQLQITPGADDWYNIVFVHDIDKTENDRLKIDYFTAFSSNLNGRTFLNIKIWGSDSNFIAEYKLTVPDRLEVFLISNDKVETLIKSGVLKGEIKEGDISKHEPPRVIVTSKTDEIVDVLKDIPQEQLHFDDESAHFVFTRPKSFKEN